MGNIYSNSYDVHWKLAEAAYGILKKGHPNVQITLPFPNWRALFMDLKREMAEVKRQQQLGRLIPQPAFINDYFDKTQPTYDFDVPTSEDPNRIDDPNHQFDLLKKARRVCYRFRVLFWCSYKIPNTGLNMFVVLAESLVLEWPVYLGGNRFWDKAQLFVNDDSNKKTPSPNSRKNGDKVETKRPTFQLRFLALEGLWKMEEKEYIYAEVHLSLHEKFDDNSYHKDPFRDDIIGVIKDFKRQPGYEYLFDCLPTGGPNPKRLQKTVLGNKVFCGLNDKTGIAINNLEIHYCGEQKSLGRNRDFVIRANVMFSTSRGTFQIGSTPNYPPQCFHLFRQNEQNYGRSSAEIGFYEMKIESLPFILQKNSCKQLFDHYHDVAWKAYNDFLTPGKYKPDKEEKEKEKEKPKLKGKKRKTEEEIPNSLINQSETYSEAKIPLKAALEWLGGIVPSLNSKWCRSCDFKEISHLRRLILFQKVCRIAFKLKDWEKAAIQLEKDLFDQVVTKKDERRKPSVWVLAMQDKLLNPLSPNAENIVMVEKDDLNEPRYAVGDDFMIVQTKNADNKADESFGKFIYLSKPAPALLKWLLDVGRAIEDSSFELGVKDATMGKSTVTMFNEKFITLRSKKRCEKIARDYRYFSNRSRNSYPPAIILCFDDSQSDQILIIYTEMKGEKEIQFGSVSISVIGNTKQMLLDHKKKDDEIKGLQVYLNEGNLAEYCHIIQIENLNQGKDTFIPCFIYHEDAEKDHCNKWLFKSRPQVILRRNEVNPLFGKIRMITRHRICHGIPPQQEYDLSRTFMKMDLSRDHSGDEPQESETGDHEIPCKRRNQEAMSESPITEASSTPAVYNSTTESDCETLANSVSQSRQWNDPEKPSQSRRPWMDLVDVLYLEVKASNDLVSNHLPVLQFTDEFMLRHDHGENQDDLQQEGHLLRSNIRSRLRTTSSDSPTSNSQSSIAQANTCSSSISSLPQTPDMQGLFEAKEFDDDDDDDENGLIHL